MTVLATATGLLGELAFGVFDHGADRFAVGHLRTTDGSFHIELTTHTVDENFEVEFAHTGNNRLAGFFVGTHAERRIFASKTAQGESHLFLVSLGLGFDGLADHRFREFHAFEDDRLGHIAERVARGHVLQTDGSGDIAGFRFGDFLTFVGVHLQQTTNTFLLVLHGVQNGFAGLKNAGVDAQEGELADIRVGHDLEGERGERSIVAGFAGDFVVVEVKARNRRNVNRRRQQFDDAVEHTLHTLVLEGRAAEHRLHFTGDRAGTQTLDDFGFGEFAFFEVLVHQLFAGFGSRFDELFTPFVGRIDEVGRDVDVFELGALAGFIPNDALHLDQVNNALELVFGADRDHDGAGIALQTGLHLVNDLEEVGAGTVHLVDERDAGHLVLVGLTPNGFGLGLHAAHSAVNHHSAVEHAHGAFDFNREVHVPRGVDDVQTMRLELHVHTAPEAGGSGRRNRDAAFLFLFHPVHGGGTVVHFAQLVVDASKEEDTLGGGRLARVDVGRNADIAIARNRGSTSHDFSLRK